MEYKCGEKNFACMWKCNYFSLMWQEKVEYCVLHIFSLISIYLTKIPYWFKKKKKGNVECLIAFTRSAILSTYISYLKKQKSWWVHNIFWLGSSNWKRSHLMRFWWPVIEFNAKLPCWFLLRTKQYVQSFYLLSSVNLCIYWFLQFPHLSFFRLTTNPKNALVNKA